MEARVCIPSELTKKYSTLTSALYTCKHVLCSSFPKAMHTKYESDKSLKRYELNKSVYLDTKLLTENTSVYQFLDRHTHDAPNILQHTHANDLIQLVNAYRPPR